MFLPKNSPALRCTVKSQQIAKERVYSHIYKQLSFLEEVIPEKAESTFRNGLLEVSIPKKTVAPAPKKHKVTVKKEDVTLKVISM
jgi:HSP20 family molecular chaperone IbpA